MDVFVWFVAFAASVCALLQAYLFFRWMMACDEGNEEMRSIATAVRDGANAYLRQQYVVVTIVFLVHRRFVGGGRIWILVCRASSFPSLF